MCTVSFFPLENGFVITSSRDESVHRGVTLPPLAYKYNQVTIIYPRDEKGLGTWIGYNEHKSVAVLLNGAFEKHEYKPPYKQSRGTIIPHVLQNHNAATAIESYDLKGIEPFTLILFCKQQLFQYKWNEKILHKTALSINERHLWNSVTLYSKEMEEKNSNMLLTVNDNVEAVYSFHQLKKYELQLPEESERNNIKTISISQLIIDNNSILFNYNDLKVANELAIV